MIFCRFCLTDSVTRMFAYKITIKRRLFTKRCITRRRLFSSCLSPAWNLAICADGQRSTHCTSCGNPKAKLWHNINAYKADEEQIPRIERLKTKTKDGPLSGRRGRSSLYCRHPFGRDGHQLSNLQDRNGDTALHISVRGGSNGIIS